MNEAFSYANTVRRRRRPARHALSGIPQERADLIEERLAEFQRQAEVFCQQHGRLSFVDDYIYAIRQATLHGNKSYLAFIGQLRQLPVDIETFLDSDEFMGGTDLEVWPEVRNTIIECCSGWFRGKTGGAYTQFLAMGATGCVDKDTEFLTPEGWVPIGEWAGQKVGQYTADGALEFVDPEEYVKLPYKRFFSFKTRTFDQLLSAGHRVIYRSAKTGELMERPAEDIVVLHNASKHGWKSGEFVGSYVGGGAGLPLTDHEIRLMVAVMADGHFYKRAGHRPQYCVFHLKKARKKARLRMLLSKCGIPYNEYERADGYSDVAFLAPQRNKNYEGWWAASQRQLQVVTSECLKWDGTEKRGEFYTRDKGSADFIQHCFCATGRRATINPSDRVDGKTDYVVHVVKSEPWRLASSKKENIGTVPSQDGFCYCFKVPTGMWVSRRNGKVVVTGNTGKSEIAKVITAYHLHLMGCLRKPQTYWGLPTAAQLVIPIFAAKPKVTKNVLYMPLRTYLEQMPWFRAHMRLNKYIEAEMRFDEQNIRVAPVGADVDSILGEAIFGAIIDEINFMQVIANSRRSQAKTGRSAKFDQATEIFTKTTRRKSGRFARNGPNVGVICTLSSTNYPGEFTDVRRQHIKDHNIKDVYVYARAQYEVKPAEDADPEDYFHVCVYSEGAKSVELRERGEDLPKECEIYDVPGRYRDDFSTDPEGAVRDVIGRSLRSQSPFIGRRSAIESAVELGKLVDLPDIVEEMNVDLAVHGMPTFVPGHFCKNPSRPRYVHIDLSHTGDRCGIAMVRFDGLMERVRKGGRIEMLPCGTVELAVSLSPSAIAEVDLAEVRAFVSKLKEVLGYPIRCVSYDGWHSLESRQEWRKQGMPTTQQTVDKAPSAAYKAFREALYDERLALPNNPELSTELRELEWDAKLEKVDHLPTGSKDIADACAGAFFVMMNRSATWNTEDEGGRILKQDDRFSSDRAHLGPRR